MLTYTPQQFIDLIAPSAVAFMRAHRISAALIIAQGGLESGWGKTAKAMGNNIFGIKADPSWHGPTTLQDTKEFINGKWVTVKARFRAYPSIQACLEDHDGFLLQPRYRNLIGADYKTACRLIAAVDHYATDPTYGQQLLDIINEYNLEKYDEEALNMTYPPVKVELNGKPFADGIDVQVKGVFTTFVLWTALQVFGTPYGKVNDSGLFMINGKEVQGVVYNGQAYFPWYVLATDIKAHGKPNNWDFVVEHPSPQLKMLAVWPMEVDGDAFVINIPMVPVGQLTNIRLQLDTGAFEILVNQANADGFNLPKLGDQQFVGVDGKPQTGYKTTLQVQVGDKVVPMPGLVDPAWPALSLTNGLFGMRGVIQQGIGLIVDPVAKTLGLYDAKESA